MSFGQHQGRGRLPSKSPQRKDFQSLCAESEFFFFFSLKADWLPIDNEHRTRAQEIGLSPPSL